jgi:hypothetical protein
LLSFESSICTDEHQSAGCRLNTIGIAVTRSHISHIVEIRACGRNRQRFVVAFPENRGAPSVSKLCVIKTPTAEEEKFSRFYGAASIQLLVVIRRS